MALLVVGCAADHLPGETGALLTIKASDALAESVASLRVRVYSGGDEDKAKWPERAHETTEVVSWPAEIFIRASDPTRGWYAHIWGLDADGTEVAFVQGGGRFRAKSVVRWQGTLESCEDCELAPPPPDLDDAGTGPDLHDASTNTQPLDGGPDAGIAPPEDAAWGRDAGPEAGAARDAAMPSVDAASKDAAVLDAAADVGAAPSDTGTPLPTNNTCATTPAFATPDACTRCICMRCAAAVATCYASNDAAKNASCKSVRDCAHSNRCTSQACYCGSSPTCLFPDGPCVSVIQTAAGATDPTGVQQAQDDPESAIYRANQVGTCEIANCAAECGL